MSEPQIVTSILSADPTRLGEQLGAALDAGARRVQVDVMDGSFVPNICMGPDIVRAIRPMVTRVGGVIEAHLMIVQPERHIADFAAAGADVIIVHVEASPQLHRTVDAIRNLGKQAAVAICPGSPVCLLEEILPDIAMALVMTVDPGAGGQKLIPQTLDKVSRLREALNRRGLSHVLIEVDGGIHRQTIASAVRAGADLLVTGSGIFNPESSISDSFHALGQLARASRVI
jgi:ribulose-phosphate 3-epimerase